MIPTSANRASFNAFAQPAAIPSEEMASTLGETDLRRIEQALLDAILDVTPNRTNAVDRLLDDMAQADGADGDGSSFDARDAGHSKRKQVEDLLAAAVLDNTSDRNRALDRLLGKTRSPGTNPATFA